MKYCLLTFDIEEWYQVENFKILIDYKDWHNKPSSVFTNTNRIIEILDDFNIKATFFILGWIAENYPDLVKFIHDNGHEIASHGYNHELVTSLDDKTVKSDIEKSKYLLENLIGDQLLGYRAPSFSIRDNLINILSELGFKYDSSFNPFQLNNRYGSLNLPTKKTGHIYQFANDLYEIPVSTLKVFNIDIPISGGAYFRLIPHRIFQKLVKIQLKKYNIYTFYLHPWELEPEQPRIKNIPINYRIRHYTGLSRTKIKLEKLIAFLKSQECKFLTMSEYIKSNNA